MLKLMLVLLSVALKQIYFLANSPLSSCNLRRLGVPNLIDSLNSITKGDQFWHRFDGSNIIDYLGIDNKADNNGFSIFWVWSITLMKVIKLTKVWKQNMVQKLAIKTKTWKSNLEMHDQYLSCIDNCQYTKLHIVGCNKFNFII